MFKELNFYKINNNWYLRFPSWSKINIPLNKDIQQLLQEFAGKTRTNYLKLKISTDAIISPFVLERETSNILTGADYSFCEVTNIHLGPLAPIILGSYPKYISFQVII